MPENIQHNLKFQVEKCVADSILYKQVKKKKMRKSDSLDIKIT